MQGRGRGRSWGGADGRQQAEHRDPGEDKADARAARKANQTIAAHSDEAFGPTTLSRALVPATYTQQVDETVAAFAGTVTVRVEAAMVRAGAVTVLVAVTV
jgi:hypothetical protein